jgi:hypothetical protein
MIHMWCVSCSASAVARKPDYKDVRVSVAVDYDISHRTSGMYHTGVDHVVCNYPD